MENMKITLSILWIAVMLTYLLGDVIRIFAGDVVLGEIDGAKFTEGMGLGIAAMMVTPILMVVLSLVLPQNRRGDLLVPEGRYARMRNVWAIPGTERLRGWVRNAGFKNVEVVDETPTTFSEQRSTEWMRFESLEQALDPDDPTRTIEGLPAPIRAIVIARP